MYHCDIAQIVDLDRYPLEQPNSEKMQALLHRGKQALDEKALFAMEGFIRPEMVPIMAEELNALLPNSCRYNNPRNAYDFVDTSFPEGHPRSIFHPCSYNQILNYQIPNNSPLRQVYYWQPLTNFLGELCGYDTFYRSDCPHLALSSKIAGDGDTDGWHYDSNDVVFSILIQEPESGGEFEYAPYIRNDTDENYNGVEAMLRDPEDLACRPALGLGNLTIFKGDLSMHRVRPVKGTRKRIVALFCYDQKPGTTFSHSYIRELEKTLPNSIN